MTRSTLISGIVAGLAVVGVTAGVAAAVSTRSGDEQVETISVAPVDAPPATPTGSATSPTTDDRDDDSVAYETVPSTGGTDSALPAEEVPVGVTSDEAVRIALAAVPGTLDDVELEVEHGRTVWDVDINGADGWAYEVDVDARTAEIVERERDDRVGDDHGGSGSDDGPDDHRGSADDSDDD